MEKVAFIGLGLMGAAMAANIARSGRRVRGYDINAEACAAGSRNGLEPATSAAHAAEGADVVITMLPDTPHVEAAILGEDGVAQTGRRGAVVIDMSTISPAASKRIAMELQKKGIGFVDAPVSGGVAGARDGKLSIMAGGSEADIASAMPVLGAMGRTIVHVGRVGAGQSVKLCNQVACVLTIQGVCEAFALGRASGLDLAKLREVMLGGAAGSWILENLGPLMLDKDGRGNFRIDLQLKDLRLVAEAAFEQGVPLPGAALVSNLYLEARAHGEGGLGNQALFKVYDRLTNRE